MKKALAWLLVLSMTAALAVGGTLAYLTDTDEDVNVMTVGQVKIDQLEYERVDVGTADEDATVQEFHDNKPLYPAVTEDGFDYIPGDSYVDWDQIGKDGYTSEIWDPTKINNEQDKMVFVKNKGDWDAYVRTVFGFEANGYTLAQFKELFHLNLNETDWTWEWTESVDISGTKYILATATYNKVLAPGAITEISLSQIALDSKATNKDIEGFGDTYQILVQSQAVQAAGFEDPATALNEAFGQISIEGEEPDIPFDSDEPTKGADLKTALHYLNADGTTAITANVSSVTFGLNKDYSNITDRYEGVLVDAEQDVPVYAYYVPNGTNYDVYCLADDTIYAPVSSDKLFNGMGALKSLNSYNFDTSRAQTLYTAFQSCVSLPSVDLSGWDVSNVTDMTGMFNKCSELVEVNAAGWDTSNVTTMYSMFNTCSKLEKVDATGWDVSNVENFYRLFRKCFVLSEIKGLEDWNPSSATTATSMFYQCYALKNLDVLSDWNTSKFEIIDWMFYQCSNLESIGTSNWDLSSVQSASEVFLGCSKLKALDSSNWKFGNVTKVNNMFQGCTELESLDVSDWDMSKVQNFYCMFYQCYALPTLDVSNWDTSSATNVQYIFGQCTQLDGIDVSKWDVSNATEFYGVFYKCQNLTSLDVSNWDMGNAVRTAYMFAECSKLESLDVSKWNVGNVTNMNRMFGACLSLETVDVSNWDVRKVQDFNSMFAGAGSNAMDMKLNYLDLSKWEPNSATDLSYFMYGCAQLTELDLSDWNMPNLKTCSHMFADCINLESIDLTGWNSPSLTSMDAMFNDCRSLKTIDVSDIDTAKVLEFSQTFEACWSLTYIYGLENWNTTSAATFDQMFLSCGSLKELNLSSFSTYTARDSYYAQNNSWSNAFPNMFGGVNSLEKLILGKNFCFEGNGSVAAGNQVKLPNPGKIDGQTTVWYNAENDTYYAASEIPDETVATYIAVVKP